MRTLIIVAIASALSLAQQPQRKQDSGQKAQMTGCVDQRGEVYVLRSTESMKAETVLRGKTFSNDNFARFVGKTAKVSGELATEGESKVLHVVEIEKVSDSCR